MTPYDQDSPVAGETPEMVEAFEGLVNSIMSGMWTEADVLLAWLRSDESTYPARMVYFGQAAWDRALALTTEKAPAAVHEPTDGEAISVDTATDLAAAYQERRPPFLRATASAVIAEGVRAIQQHRHEVFTAEAEADERAAADRMAALVDLPLLAEARPEDGADLDALTAAYRQAAATGRPEVVAATHRADPDDIATGFMRQVRRSERVAQAKAIQQYALAAILTIGVVVALVVGWSILTNGWRWWA